MLFSVSLLFSLCWLHCSLTLHLGRAGLGGSVYREGSLTEAGGAWCSQCIALYSSLGSISEMVHNNITIVTESLLTYISLWQHNYFLTCQLSPLKEKHIGNISVYTHIYRITSLEITPLVMMKHWQGAHMPLTLGVPWEETRCSYWGLQLPSHNTNVILFHIF